LRLFDFLLLHTKLICFFFLFLNLSFQALALSLLGDGSGFRQPPMAEDENKDGEDASPFVPNPLEHFDNNGFAPLHLAVSVGSAL
jgi:hypothetical protein